MTNSIAGDWPEGFMPCVEAFLAEDYLRPPGHDVYQDCFDSPWFFPLQRREELRRMIQIARTVGQRECDECSGKGSVEQTPFWSDGPRDNCETCKGTGKVGGPVTVMEIGADKGSGLYHWCKALPTIKRVVACEIRGTPYDEAFNKAFKHISYLWLPYPSTGRIGTGIYKHLGEVTESVVAATSAWLRANGDLGQDPDVMGSKTPAKIDVLFIDGDKTKFVEDFDAYLPLMNPNGVVFMHDVTDREPCKAFDEIKARGKWRTDVIIDRTDTNEAMDRASKGVPPASAHEGWLRHWEGRSCGVGVIWLNKDA